MPSACSILYYLWPVWLYNIFPNYLINNTILEKILLNTKCVLWFSLQLLSEAFPILRRIGCNVIMNVHTVRLHVKYLLFLWDFNETSIFLTHFQKILKYKYHTNPSSGSYVVPCGQRDEQTDTTKLTGAVSNFANMPKSSHLWMYNIRGKPVIITYYVKVFQYIVLCAGTLCFMLGMCSNK